MLKSATGNLGLCQRLDNVVEAAEHLLGRGDMLFLLVGGGALKAWLADQVLECGLTNVRFLPYQPKARLAESLSAADVHLGASRVASGILPNAEQILWRARL
jgi:hypothetical protein